MAAATTDELRIIRTLIPDTEAVFGAANNATMFSDTELGDFFTAGRLSVLRAAAYANQAIAASEALISKKIKTQDLQTDGPAVATALLLKADSLFKQADKEDEANNTGYFQIVDFEAGWTVPELTEWENW